MDYACFNALLDNIYYASLRGYLEFYLLFDNLTLC